MSNCLLRSAVLDKQLVQVVKKLQLHALAVGHFCRMLTSSQCELFKSTELGRARTYASNESANKNTRRGPPWRILFFGTDVFSTKILQSLIDVRFTNDEDLINNLDVVSLKGQTAVRVLAQKAGLSIHDWPIPELSGYYDLGVVASFGHMISSSTINYFPHGIYNVHPSLLPRWRGASPIVHTILAGDRVTGVSIMKLKPKHFDVGGIVSTCEVPVPEGCVASELRELLADYGGKQMIHVLRNLIDLPIIDQSKTGSTYAYKAKNNMAYIDWESQRYEDIEKQHRALAEFMPLRSELDGKPVKLLDMQSSSIMKDPSLDDSSMPGTVIYNKNKDCLSVKCLDGWVSFRHIVLRKKMTAREFYNGYLSKTTDRKLLLASIANGLDKVKVKL